MADKSLKSSKDQLLLAHQYKSLLQTLSYLSIIARPNIRQAVNLAARYQQHPTQDQYDHLLRIVAYLHHSKDKALTFLRQVAPTSRSNG